MTSFSTYVKIAELNTKKKRQKINPNDGKQPDTPSVLDVLKREKSRTDLVQPKVFSPSQ